jgi:DNA-directed RNA polymerase subunit M/transcription elongation factor TFIIS
MDKFDPAAEYLQIAERYRQMKDEELLVLMPQISELTDSAQQALANEFRSRGLKLDVKDEKAPSPTSAKPRSASFERAAPKFANLAESESAIGEAVDENAEEEGDSYEEDRELVEYEIVWSARDALKIQTILDQAGIPFFIGPERATSVDQVTSDFAKGLSVKIMKVGMPWAIPLMQHYEPEDDPRPKEEPVEELPVRCPVCHSTEVVFEGLSDEKASEADDAPEKFKWTCDACGNQWEDDGTVKEA